MDALSRQVFHLAERQHGIVALWQLARSGTSKEIELAVRGLRRVFRGVCATGDLSELGWFMAGALAMGDSGAISHLSALQLLGLRPPAPGDLHVSFIGGSGRLPREGLIPHRRRHIETGTCHGIPVTSPTQSLKDADLRPYALYRAIEQAETLGYSTSLRLDDPTVRLKRAVRGKTRSDAEAQLLILCQQHGIELPLVNHRLNGIITDFHWPGPRVVLEVDGWEFHKERAQFEEDRRRELVHAAAGWQVIRASGLQVMTEPELVVGALRARC